MIPFDIRKTIEAAAYLIKRQDCQIENYMRLIKLLYLADRLSLKERGVAICGGDVYAMPRGPVISPALDLIKGIDSRSAQWSEWIERRGYSVQVKKDPGTVSLSRAELKILERIADEFRLFDEWDIVEWCHENLPEYQKNWEAKGEQNRKRIQLEDVLEAIGRSQDRAAIIAGINESAAFDKLFGNHLPT